MTIRLLAVSVLLAASTASVHGAAEIDPSLRNAMNSAGPQTVKALLYLHDQVDYDTMNAQMMAERATRAHRHRMGVELLRDIASSTQSDLLGAIDDLQAAGEVKSHRAYWITNAIQVDATVSGLQQLADHEDVMIMYLDHPIELVSPVDEDEVEVVPPSALRGAVSPDGIYAVRADECWAAGFDGTGVVVANMDTGVDGSHPALASRWRGNEPGYAQEWAWHDPYLNQFPPYDNGGHGTHCMGSVVGGFPGEPVGVAPGAQWIASASIDRNGIEQTVSDAIEAFQWFADPDGDPSTSWDVPNVCSNSWGLITAHGYPECDQTFWSFVDNCELVGVVVLFSAGNEGSSGLRRPGDRATDEYRSCAVAAIDPASSNWPVAGFSSRGPTFCTTDGSVAIKPDISAPGVSTYSSYPGGSYTSLSGTSMASPHINGVVAIMCQANPDLPPDVVKQILYDTAVDLGTPGKDNDYGWGMVDAWEALQSALATVGLSFEFPSGRPALIEPTGGQVMPVSISGPDVANPDSATLHVRYPGGTWSEHPVQHLLGSFYEVVFPEFDCGAEVQWYISIETIEGDYTTSPFSAPGSVYSAQALSGIDLVVDENFEAETGWTVSGDALTGMWSRGTPQWGNARCEPGSDADGSGQCFVTGNGSSDEDLDDGSTTVTSPAMSTTDASVLTYQRWYNNGSNCAGADPQNDIFVVEFSVDGGGSWSTLEVVGPAGDGVDGGWVEASFSLNEVAGFVPSDQFRVRFTASDLNDGSIVEAGIDAVLITDAYCNDSVVPGDANGDGVISVEDLLFVIANWGNPFDVNDLLEVIANWGG
ncbi:MAG: S8 family serine peptidase [Planctomycetota bacterium]|nr:S8 family serine peptidase [Planctomycetota bacterium]